MAAARLIDSQKHELVRRFRQGESTQALADFFGCSSTTITRMVRAELGPEEYAALRDQRQRRGGRDRQISLAIEGETSGGAATPEPEVTAGSPDSPTAPGSSEPFEGLCAPEEGSLSGGAEDANPASADSGGASSTPLEAPVQAAEAPPTQSPSNDDEPLDADAGGATGLAIDDADDFADGEESEEDLLAVDEDTDDDSASDLDDFRPVPVLAIAVDDQRETRPTPWTPEMLPACAYLLVDKTVELQAKPLGEIPELGRLPSEEQERQALVLFTNPRQAKRLCGRTQRVIKLPDPALLGRTAPYLLAQGISRVVIEGALYALPEAP